MNTYLVIDNVSGEVVKRCFSWASAKRSVCRRGGYPGWIIGVESRYGPDNVTLRLHD